MSRLHELINRMNKNTFNPVGLNIVWPKNVAFLFVSDRPLALPLDANFASPQLEIEYYVRRSFYLLICPIVCADTGSTVTLLRAVGGLTLCIAIVG